MSLKDCTLKEKKCFIGQNFKKMQVKDIADTLGCSVGVVYYIANKLGLSNKNGWYKSHDEFVKAKCKTMTAKEIADMIGFSKYYVEKALERLGLQAAVKINSRHWKDEHDELLKVKFATMTMVDIANEMGFPIYTIKASAKRQGLSKYKMWDDKCDEYLIKHYRKMSQEDIAKNLGTSLSSIYRHAKRLKKEKRITA